VDVWGGTFGWVLLCAAAAGGRVLRVVAATASVANAAVLVATHTLHSCFTHTPITNRSHSRRVHNLHLRYIDPLTLLLHIPVLKLRDLNHVHILSGGVDCEHLIGVQEVHAHWDLVLEMQFSRGGEVLVYLGEKVQVFLDCCDQEV